MRIFETFVSVLKIIRSEEGGSLVASETKVASHKAEFIRTFYV